MNTQFPIIKNLDNLTTTRLREDALSILEEGYESVVTERIIRSKITIEGENICVNDLKICMSDYERIFLIAIGKCAVSSAETLEDLLKDKISGGVVLDVKKGHFKTMISEEGTHPLPSGKNVATTKSIVDLVKQATKKDLILTVISGGGSSLMCLPYKMDWDSQADISRELMKKGATIDELNTVRKHTSLVKGGQLAKLAYPANMVSFIMSDVPGDDLSVIASGPTVMDKTTKKDAEDILNKYKIRESFPDIKIELNETPKNEKYFAKVKNILLVSNITALDAMRKKAEDLGYDAFVEDFKLEGEARELGKKFALKDILPGSCHIWGGETTVVVEGNGVGGRNQEFVLGALPYIQENTVVIAGASDGWDNSDATGAIADRELFEKILDRGLDYEKYLKENNSFEFWKQAGGQIITGRTGTNVADFYMVLKGKEELTEEDEIYSENEVLGDALYEKEEEN